MNARKTYIRLGLALMTSVSLSACGAGERLANIGKPPAMAEIQNPQLQAGYRPVSMPMPAPKIAVRQPNSLWDSNRQAFFKDQRASNVGDILTVLIDIDDEATFENDTERKRTTNEDSHLDTFLGYEASLAQVLPEAVNPANLVGMNSNSDHKGEASTERDEEVKVQVAAVITQILPNGNFVIHGKQETRVNFEKRIVQIDGIVRPQDISTNNTVSHDQIAEARIIYGGEGQLTDVQQPRYGQQVYDVLFPF